MTGQRAYVLGLAKSVGLSLQRAENADSLLARAADSGFAGLIGQSSIA
ncbi:hypothetical protein [Bradyrhizobium prioriisuperbiae]|nr:hypothetical protein [Bradyrhizobium prioritasuperba]